MEGSAKFKVVQYHQLQTHSISQELAWRWRCWQPDGSDLSIHAIAHQPNLGREVKSRFARALSETTSLVLYDTNSGVFERKYASEGGVKLNITLYHQLPSYRSAMSIIEVTYAGRCWQPGFSNLCRHSANSLLEFVREAKSRLTTGALSETASLAWHNMWCLRSHRKLWGAPHGL